MILINTDERGASIAQVLRKLIEKVWTTLQLPNGAQPLRDVLDPLQGEQFNSPEEVRQAVLGLVSKQAIGRERYSDRTPPALGEEAERAMDHPDMTEELAEILSTKLVRLEYRVETSVQINGE